MLNKTVLPSTEPDRRAFSFDIIPSGLIDNIMVAKSATANLPGDFAGGIVQITTKDVSNDFFSLGLGASYGAVSTFQNFKLVDYTIVPTQFPSTYTYRTSTNTEKKNYTSLIKSPDAQQFKSIPNLNGSLSFGIKRNKWNILFSSTARDTYALNYIDRQDYQSSSELAYKYKDTSFSRIQLLNGLANITYIGKKPLQLENII